MVKARQGTSEGGKDWLMSILLDCSDFNFPLFVFLMSILDHIHHICLIASRVKLLALFECAPVPLLVMELIYSSKIQLYQVNVCLPMVL